jgi:hypothetical protein
MLSAEKFYDCADEHFGWAETAKTERERANLSSNGGGLAGGRAKAGRLRKTARSTNVFHYTHEPALGWRRQNRVLRRSVLACARKRSPAREMQNVCWQQHPRVHFLLPD